MFNFEQFIQLKNQRAKKSSFFKIGQRPLDFILGLHSGAFLNHLLGDRTGQWNIKVIDRSIKPNLFQQKAHLRWAKECAVDKLTCNGEFMIKTEIQWENSSSLAYIF